MNCPWCAFEGAPRALHAHLAGEHPDAVRTKEMNGTQFYEVTCPVCGESYEHRLRKGTRDPRFLDEFGGEIRMVALDMLVHHLVAEHTEQQTGA
ncbi:hypothetical protein [Amycolatopsis alkalitolerans]|uniref:Uncharacterized protein n=1 Tax=Amycolatopsis alkalitolerans TaxID=2547244 RepID=A0A5C4M070_9PSEU|nr:hypothetical protein [Amycolatopsis alkalitolerans]TNC25821.1 hypothetical protein FG385_14370 [Amycolatopsis alkalitolerans]